MKTLQQGLEILAKVVAAGRPVLPGEIAEAVGIHRSTASRILTTLADQGLVRRHRHRGYVPDMGVFALGAMSVEGFSLVKSAWDPMHAIAAANPGCEAALVTLWQGETLYFCRSSGDRRPLPFSSVSYPLHQSTASLRLLLDQARDEAVAALELSRSKRGWEDPMGVIPDEPDALLDRVSTLVEHSTLVTCGWLAADHIAGAIPVAVPDSTPFVLSIVGNTTVVDESSLRIRLLDGRHLLEDALRD